MRTKQKTWEVTQASSFHEVPAASEYEKTSTMSLYSDRKTELQI